MALNINGTTGISGVDGSASAPALQGTDSNTGINFASDTVNINTGGVTRATVDSSGALDVPTDFPIKVNGSEKLRVDSSGRLLLGTSSTPSAGVQFDIKRTDTTTYSASSNHVNGLKIFNDSNTDNGFAGIELAATDSDDYYGSVVLKAIATGTNYSNDFVIQTRDSGNYGERMRITSNGKFYVGTTDGAFGNDAAQHAAIVNGTANEYTLSLRNTVDSSDGRTLLCAAGKSTGGRLIFFERADGTTVGSITHNGSATAFNTSSDYRLKENVTAISDGITRLKTLKPSKFNFIGNSKIVDGFLAHEVTAVPEAITGTKDETQDILYTEEDTIPSGKKVGDVKETVPKYQGIDQSKLVPLLTAALQEAVAKIEVLETKVAALEAA
jgi:hypothetical protein